jgi:hypothetical protein
MNQTEALRKNDALPEAVEQALLADDLSGLSPAQRLSLYKATCSSLGLNPLTNPFRYLRLSGMLKLYAQKNCAEQLRKLHGISLEVTSSQWSLDGELYAVNARARTPDGRTDEDIGVVWMGPGMTGEARANAQMKALTKAKRRVTLSICGLGMLDDSEIDSIPGAERVSDHDEVPVHDITPAGESIPFQAAIAEAMEAASPGNLSYDTSSAERLRADDCIRRLERLKEADRESATVVGKAILEEAKSLPLDLRAGIDAKAEEVREVFRLRSKTVQG